MAIENLTSVTTGLTVDSKATGDVVTADTYKQMLEVLDSLTDHTHLFYDDYSTNCNCNCNCACGRGSC